MAQVSQRILIVDDEVPLRDIFARGLSRNSYSCDTAGSTDEVNNLLRVEEFDLVLLDISMTGKTGVSLLATLSKSFPDMAIVMVSGNDDLETATFAMRQGADDYLAKPVPISLLVYRIEKALLRRALVLENRAYRVHPEIW
jgi:DNA-binding response OmpR family regulator